MSELKIKTGNLFDVMSGGKVVNQGVKVVKIDDRRVLETSPSISTLPLPIDLESFEKFENTWRYALPAPPDNPNETPATPLTPEIWAEKLGIDSLTEELKAYFESPNFKSDSFVALLAHFNLISPELVPILGEIKLTKESHSGILAKLGLIKSGLTAEAQQKIADSQTLLDYNKSAPLPPARKAAMLALAEEQHASLVASLTAKVSNNVDALNKVFKDATILKGATRSSGGIGGGSDERTGEAIKFDESRKLIRVSTTGSKAHRPTLIAHYDLLTEESKGLVDKWEKYQTPGLFYVFELSEDFSLGDRETKGEKTESSDSRRYYRTVEASGVTLLGKFLVDIPRYTGSMFNKELLKIVGSGSGQNMAPWDGLSLVDSLSGGIEAYFTK